MYQLIFTETFWEKYHLLVKSDPAKKKVVKSLQLFAENPRHPSLRSHKVLSKQFGEKWSSSVTGDLRIIWEYDEKVGLRILVLTLGGHTGKHAVYK